MKGVIGKKRMSPAFLSRFCFVMRTTLRRGSASANVMRVAIFVFPAREKNAQKLVFPPKAVCARMLLERALFRHEEGARELASESVDCQHSN